MHTYVCACVCVCIYVNIYTCMYVCMYAYPHTHARARTHTHRQRERRTHARTLTHTIVRMRAGVGRGLAPPRQSHARCRPDPARNAPANSPPEHARCTHTPTCKGGTGLQHCAAAGNVLRLRPLPDASALRPRRTLAGMSVYPAPDTALHTQRDTEC